MKTFKKMIHLTFYVMYLVIIYLIWTSGFFMYEKIFWTGISIYFILIHLEFFDNSLLYRFKISELSGEEKRHDNEEFLADVLSISHGALATIRQIQTSETEREREVSIERLRYYLSEVENLIPPKKFINRKREIEEDIAGFLLALES